MTSTFDLTAAGFEMYRALPPGAPEAIRQSIWKASGKAFNARVLDLGAGTGRIGKAFVQAHDAYFAVDLSLPMLQEFRAHSRTAGLAQASGEHLPFPDRRFDLVLLMQVLSGTENWHCLLEEAQRVLAPHGAIVVGQTVMPEDGIDARMKRRLANILEEMAESSHKPGKTRKQALAWLESGAVRHIHATAASWTAMRKPRDFILRHRTGARFAALTHAVQEQALKELSAWAGKAFASLDKEFTEEHSFELDVFEFGKQ